MVSDESAHGNERWDSEEEFLEWINDYCDYVIALGEPGASSQEISNALKMRGIQSDLESGKISFEEALERYNRDIRTNTDQEGENGEQ